MLVKASRAWMSDLTRDDVAICRIADGATTNERKPSVEIGFHAGILRARPDVNVVLHFQTPAATTLACMDLKDANFAVIPEVPYYLGPVGDVGYLAPGSEGLAGAVTAVMLDHDVALLRNHGQITVAKDFRGAIQNAVFFELACEILLRGGDRVRPLSEADVRALRPTVSRRGSAAAV
jgi:ribulose-5-phosphate 4-epimerase/fuculose-1-phosphate aldolase